MTVAVSHDDTWIYDRLCALMYRPEPTLDDLGKASPETLRRLLAIARIHGVLGVALEKLSHLAPVLGDMWETSKRSWHAEIAQSMRVRRHSDLLMAHLAKSKIPAVCFKGADFADNLYANPQLRPTFDVDVLVPFQRWDDAVRAIEGMGHREKSDQPPMKIEAGLIGERSWLYSGVHEIEVDLHWDLVHLPFFRPFASIQYHHVDLEPSGADGQVRLLPSSRFVIAAVHAVYHHQFDRMRLLLDIQHACRPLKDPGVFEKARECIARTGTGLAVDLSLILAARMLNDPEMEELRRSLLGADPRWNPRPELFPTELLACARKSMYSIKTNFNSPSRRKMREFLLWAASKVQATAY